MLKLISSLLLTLILLSSCHLRPTAPPDYRESDFEAEIAWSTEGVILVATVSARGATKDSPARITTLHLTQPPALQGIVLSWAPDGITVDCHGMIADAAPLEELWRTAEWLTVTGTLTPIAVTEEMGSPLLYAEGTTDDSEARYEFYLDPHSGIPQKIRLGDKELEIRSFTPQG